MAAFGDLTESRHFCSLYVRLSKLPNEMVRIIEKVPHKIVS